MTKLTITELAAESVELLPGRDTLFLNFNWANVLASNSSNAVNVFTLGSGAASQANQGIAVVQLG
jgi:hypothetical protein